jgi:hypothetical protein
MLPKHDDFLLKREDGFCIERFLSVDLPMFSFHRSNPHVIEQYDTNTFTVFGLASRRLHLLLIMLFL